MQTTIKPDSRFNALYDIISEEHKASHMPWKFPSASAVKSADEASPFVANYTAIKTGEAEAGATWIRMVRAVDAMPITLLNNINMTIDSAIAEHVQGGLAKLVATAVARGLTQSDGAVLVTSAASKFLQSANKSVVRVIGKSGLTIEEVVKEMPELAEPLSYTASGFMFVSPSDPTYSNIEGYEVTIEEVRSIKNPKIGLEALWRTAKMRARKDWIETKRDDKRMTTPPSPGVRTMNGVKLKEIGDTDNLTSTSEAAANQWAIEATNELNRMSLITDIPTVKIVPLKPMMKYISENSTPGFIGQISWLIALGVEESQLTPGVREILKSGKLGPSQGVWQIQDRYATHKLPKYTEATADMYNKLEAMNAAIMMRAFHDQVMGIYQHSDSQDTNSPLIPRAGLSPTYKKKAELMLKYMRNEMPGIADGIIEKWYLMSAAWGIGRPLIPTTQKMEDAFYVQAKMRRAVTKATVYAYLTSLPTRTGLIT